MESERKIMDWQASAQALIRQACTPWGIKAALVDLDNYGAIFTRDAVMAGIAGMLLGDASILAGFKNTLDNLRELQGAQGQIASNFTVREGKIVSVSFGSLSPKIDACTWYLVGVGLLLKEGVLKKEDFQESIEKAIGLLEAWEYNGKHLIYVPKGGNWADEYIFDGYILYDQLLRAWGLELLAQVYKNIEWHNKSAEIIASVNKSYSNTAQPFFYSSIYPGGAFKKFDLAAHALAALVLPKDNLFLEQALDWVGTQFIDKMVFPPAFYPVIAEQDAEWETLKNYHLFAFKNKPYHYHNGGIWWIWLGWLSVALAFAGKQDSLKKLTTLAFNYLDQVEQFEFEEYLSADQLVPEGTKKLCYTATGIIFLSLAKSGVDFEKLKL